MPYEHNKWYDLRFLLAWCFGQLSAKRSPNHSLKESCNFLFSKHERPLQLSEGITNDYQICKIQGYLEVPTDYGRGSFLLSGHPSMAFIGSLGA